MAENRFIPFEKMSKKKKREIESARRGTWGAISPVTRRVECKKAYNRKKVRMEKNDFCHTEPFLYIYRGFESI